MTRDEAKELLCEMAEECDSQLGSSLGNREAFWKKFYAAMRALGFPVEEFPK
jgi:hypothetical protein